MKQIYLNILLFIYNLSLILILIIYSLFLLVTFQKTKLVNLLNKNFNWGKWLKLFNADSCIWLHASSVGESLQSFYLIEQLLQIYPDYKILVTTCTQSSKKLWEQHFKTELNSRLIHCYLPWDIYFIIHRFIKCFNIKLVIFIESDFWPNLLTALRVHNIPSILLNARLSVRSFVRWKKSKLFFQYLLKGFSFISADSKASQERIGFFINPNKIKTLPNLKWFNGFVNNSKLISYPNRVTFPLDKMVLLGISTHSPEEEMLVQTHLELKQTIPNLVTIIAPRHVNRVPAILKIIQEYNINIQIGITDSLDDKVDIIIVNQWGLISELCKLANIAYIGKSMFKQAQGGHNLLEPLNVGIKVIFGRYMQNFAELSQLALDKNLAVMVNSPEELVEQLKVLLLDKANIKSKDSLVDNLITSDDFSSYLQVIKQVLRN